MFIIFWNINSKLACSCGNSKIFEKKICVSFRWSMLDVNCVFVVLIIDIFSALWHLWLYVYACCLSMYLVCLCMLSLYACCCLMHVVSLYMLLSNACCCLMHVVSLCMFSSLHGYKYNWTGISWLVYRPVTAEPISVTIHHTRFNF